MDGVIRAHCMGMEFPKRDTDGPGVKWSYPCPVHMLASWKCPICMGLPSAADLDAVAKEQRVKGKTGAQVPNR